MHTRGAATVRRILDEQLAPLEALYRGIADGRLDGDAWLDNVAEVVDRILADDDARALIEHAANRRVDMLVGQTVRGFPITERLAAYAVDAADELAAGHLPLELMRVLWPDDDVDTLLSIDTRKSELGAALCDALRDTHDEAARLRSDACRLLSHCYVAFHDSPRDVRLVQSDYLSSGLYTSPRARAGKPEAVLAALRDLAELPAGLSDGREHRDEPDSTGYVESPVDPDAYAPLAAIVSKHTPDRPMTTKQATKIVDDYSANRVRWTRPPGRDGQPRGNRRSVHLGDWNLYLDGTRGIDDGWPKTTDEERTRRTDEIRQRKAAGK